MIEALTAAYPEWTEIADFLAVTAETPTPGEFYRTIFHKERGYVASTESAPETP
jgi:hypothetical protein